MFFDVKISWFLWDYSHCTCVCVCTFWFETFLFFFLIELLDTVIGRFCAIYLPKMIVLLVQFGFFSFLFCITCWLDLFNHLPVCRSICFRSKRAQSLRHLRSLFVTGWVVVVRNAHAWSGQWWRCCQCSFDFFVFLFDFLCFDRSLPFICFFTEEDHTHTQPSERKVQISYTEKKNKSENFCGQFECFGHWLQHNWPAREEFVEKEKDVESRSYFSSQDHQFGIFSFLVSMS